MLRDGSFQHHPPSPIASRGGHQQDSTPEIHGDPRSPPEFAGIPGASWSTPESTGVSRSLMESHGDSRSSRRSPELCGVLRSLMESHGVSRSLAESGGASRSLAEFPETPEPHGIPGISGASRSLPDTTGTHAEYLMVPPPRLLPRIRWVRHCLPPGEHTHTHSHTHQQGSHSRG
jgi:hypothetical protein